MNLQALQFYPQAGDTKKKCKTRKVFAFPENALDIQYIAYFTQMMSNHYFSTCVHWGRNYTGNLVA